MIISSSKTIVHCCVSPPPLNEPSLLLLTKQDAQKKELDLRAPVEKQRAKKFNIDEELQRLKSATVDREYRNKPIPRP